MSHRSNLLLIVLVLACTNALAQNVPNVSQVLMWSTASDRFVRSTIGPFTPNTTGTVPKALFTVYTNTASADPTGDSTIFLNAVNKVSNYTAATSALSSALSSNIGVALSIVPLASPTSSVILKTDAATGLPLPVSSTLGPIFTQRAETVGKGKFYLGFTHQNVHFTSLNGQSLNGLSILYPGGDKSGIVDPTTGVQALTVPATFNLALDVRLSQEIAFLTMGVTNRFDISVGFPLVHASVAATSYNGIVYSGSGLEFTGGNKCWCMNTLTPGTFELTAPQIGRASFSKTGFGDLLLRFKQTVWDNPHSVVAIGTDLRLPTGDADNYLGAGTTSVKPYLAWSLYSSPLFRGVVFAPHVDAGWQFSGKSILGGQLQGTQQFATMQNGERIPFVGLPITATKDYLPDIFSWAVGTEIAFGRRNTFVVDVLGNQIGWINGAQTLRSQARAASFAAPTDAGIVPQSSGLANGGRTSFGQYSGAFGYKAKLPGNMVATFQILTRFDNNGLTARVVPLYGLGYSF